MSRVINANSKNILFDLLQNGDTSEENTAILDGLDAIERLEKINKIIEEWKSGDYQNSKDYIYKIGSIVNIGADGNINVFKLKNIK